MRVRPRLVASASTRGEDNARVVGRHPSMQVGEGVGEPGPAMHVGQHTGDAGIWDHRIEPLCGVFRFFRGDRLERRDLQLVAFDPDVLQRVRRGFGVDLAHAPFQEGAAFGQVFLSGCRHSDRQGPGLPHGGEQGGRNELVLDCAPLPAALDPDVPGAQPVAQCEQGGGLPSAAMLGARFAAAVPHGVPPGRTEETGWQAFRPFPAAGAICLMQQLDRAQRCRGGGHGTELEGIEKHRTKPVQHRPGTQSHSRTHRRSGSRLRAP